MLESASKSFTQLSDYLTSQPSSWFLQLSFYILGGCVFGFLCKYYLRYIIVSLVVALLAIWCLEYFSLITIKYESMQHIFGTSLNIFSLGNSILLWMQTHVAYAISLIIGFLLGWLLS